MTKKKLAEELAYIGMANSVFTEPIIRRTLEQGKPIPDHELPGRMLERLKKCMSDEELEVLKDLKASDFYHRLDY